MDKRKRMKELLTERYGREPTEEEIDRGFELFEIDDNPIRCFLRGLSRKLF